MVTLTSTAHYQLSHVYQNSFEYVKLLKSYHLETKFLFLVMVTLTPPASLSNSTFTPVYQKLFESVKPFMSYRPETIKSNRQIDGRNNKLTTVFPDILIHKTAFT